MDRESVSPALAREYLTPPGSVHDQLDVAAGGGAGDQRTGTPGGQLPQHRPVKFRPGRPGPGAVPGNTDSQRLRLDGAADRCRHHDRLTVDADGDLGYVGVHHDLAGGKRGQAAAAGAAQKIDGLQCVVHRHRDDAEGPGIQPRTAAQPRDVAQRVRIVADQQRLGAGHHGLTGADGQPGTTVPAQQLGQYLQGDTPLVVPVGRVLHHLGVGAERGVVHERPVTDEAEVDLLFYAVAGQGGQAGRRILAVQPEVHREVVAGARADDQEREIMLGGDPGHQGLCPVASRYTEQVRPGGDRSPGQLGHVHDARAFKQHHLGPQRFGLLLQPELRYLPAARPRVHDQESASGRRDLPYRHALAGRSRGQHQRERQPGGTQSQHQQHSRPHGNPDQVVPGKHHEHGDRDQDHQGERQPPQHTPVSKEPVPARRYQAHSDRPDGHHGQAGQLRDTDQDPGRGKHQRESGPGQPPSAHNPPSGAGQLRDISGIIWPRRPPSSA